MRCSSGGLLKSRAFSLIAALVVDWSSSSCGSVGSSGVLAILFLLKLRTGALHVSFTTAVKAGVVAEALRTLVRRERALRLGLPGSRGCRRGGLCRGGLRGSGRARGRWDGSRSLTEGLTGRRDLVEAHLLAKAMIQLLTEGDVLVVSHLFIVKGAYGFAEFLRDSFMHHVSQHVVIVLGAKGVALEVSEEGGEVAVRHADGAELHPSCPLWIGVAKVELKSIEEVLEGVESERAIVAYVVTHGVLRDTGQEKVKVSDLLVLRVPPILIALCLQATVANKALKVAAIA